MYRESAHLHLLSTGLLPTVLLVLTVGCGSAAPSGSDETPSDKPPAEETPTSQVPPNGTAEREGSPTPVPPPAAKAAAWFHPLGGPQDDLGTGLAVDATGHVTVAWVSTPRQDADREPVSGEHLSFSLARYSAEGQVLWTREFPRNRVDTLRVVAAPSGELFLSGNAFLYDVDFGLDSPASDGFLVKLSPEGQTLWQKRVGQKVYASVVDASGGVFVAAEEWTGQGNVPVLAHYDAQGNRVWTRSLAAVSDETALHALALTPSGRSVTYNGN